MLQAVFTILPLRCALGLQRFAAMLHSSSPRDAGVLGQALFDAICVAIFLLAVLFLQSINAGKAVYDLSQPCSPTFLCSFRVRSELCQLKCCISTSAEHVQHQLQSQLAGIQLIIDQEFTMLSCRMQARSTFG